MENEFIKNVYVINMMKADAINMNKDSTQII